MKKCNKCSKRLPTTMFRSKEIKTCKRCEFRWYQRFLRVLVKERKLSPIERLSNRLGYMGTGFIMISPHILSYDLLGAYTYVIGGVLSMPQVFVAKQWNLVLVNLNVSIGYLIYILHAI
jgi:hypothetical protein